MVKTISAVSAGRHARDLLVAARDPEGGYRLPSWPDAGRGRSDGAAAASAVVSLRVVQRALVGFLDPVEDALYLTAGLRRLGFAASFHLGREIAPAVAPGGFHAWVECGGTVVSTSLPVRDEYLPVYSSE
ncbi:MAG: lasso peptide biosynthesis protein [Solirubrobacteraceae bacterium]